MISDWYSDLSGITVINIKEGKVYFEKELNIYLSDWYESNGEYYTREWDGSKIIDNLFKLDFEQKSVEKVNMKFDDLNNPQKVYLFDDYPLKNNCYCNP